MKKSGKQQPPKEMDRHTCIQKISFDANNYPVMGELIGISIAIKEPSGDKIKVLT